MQGVEYIQRSMEPTVERALTAFPIVTLTGPRQAGKTTLLKRLLADTHAYVSLELPDVQQSAVSDPRGFLRTYAPPVIYDEIQYAPELLPYIKEVVDERRGETGLFVLSGSQNVMLLSTVRESLAGRTAILRLLPLSFREREKRSDMKLPWEDTPGLPRMERTDLLWETILRGGYPEVATGQNPEPDLWMSGFVQTYLERDVRGLRQVGNLTQFRSFLTMIAARTGGLLSLSDISRDLGVAVNTIRAWIGVMEATHQLLILRPYHANIGKRLVKSPKVYMTDTGLACHLVGLKDAEHLSSGPMRGALYETAVIMEIVATLTARGIEPQLYFWRTATGIEVDLLITTQTGLLPLEIRSTATPTPRMAESLRAFRSDVSHLSDQAYLVHAGEHSLPLGDGIVALPFGSL